MIADVKREDLNDAWFRENLNAFVMEHLKMRKDIQKMIDYQDGIHSPILNRHFVNEFVPNNKLVNNFPKYITTVAVGYFMGNPISYQSVDVKNDETVKEFTSILKKVDIESVDIDIATSCSITGRGYELLKPYELDDVILPRSYALDSRNAFVVRENTVESEPLFGVYYTTPRESTRLINGSYLIVATDTHLYEYVYNDSGLVLDKPAVPHYFGIVPIIEYKNNHGGRGDYQDVISLIDAYNLLQSDRVNDKEQLIDAILMLKGVNLEDNAVVSNIKENRILVLPDDGDGEWLTKQLQEADVEILRKTLENDIHKFSLTPNITDEQFSGNASGVAMQYKLFGFEQLIKTKERFFQEGLRLRLKGYLNFLSKKNILNDISPRDVDFIFNRNLPTNNIEVAQMVSQLQNILSTETLISQIPFVKDIQVELQRIEAEDEKYTANMQKGLGFPNINEDEDGEEDDESDREAADETREESR